MMDGVRADVDLRVSRWESGGFLGISEIAQVEEGCRVDAGC